MAIRVKAKNSVPVNLRVSGASGLGRNQFTLQLDNLNRLDKELARRDLSSSQRAAKLAKRERAIANLRALAETAKSYYV